MMRVISESDFDVKSGVYAVKFGATWCSPCKKIEPLINELESEFSSVKFLEVDVDEVPGLAQNYKIKTVPTILLINDGEEVNRIAGLSMMDPMRAAFKKASKHIR
jgi:thioredoxin 1